MVNCNKAGIEIRLDDFIIQLLPFDLRITLLYQKENFDATTNIFVHLPTAITGTPYQLYVSPEGTYGMIFILLDNGQQEAIPLNAIAAIYEYNLHFPGNSEQQQTKGCSPPNCHYKQNLTKTVPPYAVFCL